MNSITTLRAMVERLRGARAISYVDMALQFHNVETETAGPIEGGRWHRWERRYLDPGEVAAMVAMADTQEEADRLALRVHEIKVHNGQWALVFDETNKLIMVVSGRRGGKSKGGSAKCVRKLITMPGVAGQTVCPTWSKTGITWNYARQSIPYWWAAKVDNSNRVIHLHNGSKWQFASAFRSDSMIGDGIHWLHIDESQSVSDEAVDLVMPALADGGTKAQAWHTGTPRPGIFRTRVEKYKVEKAKIYKFPSLDNPFLETGPGSAFDLARRTMDSQRYRREIEAEWESEEGLVYYTFRRAMHVRDYAASGERGPDGKPGAVDFTRQFLRDELEVEKDFLIGIDYGHNRHFAIVYRLVKYHGQLCFWAIDEASFDKNASVEMLGRNLQVNGYGNAVVIDDSNGRYTGGTAILEAMGFDVYHPRKNPPVVKRSNAVNSLMQASNGLPPRYFVDPKCEGLARCYENQELINGKPDKESNFDHLIDAGGYPVAFFMSAEIDFESGEQLASGNA